MESSSQCVISGEVNVEGLGGGEQSEEVPAAPGDGPRVHVPSYAGKHRHATKKEKDHIGAALDVSAKEN